MSKAAYKESDVFNASSRFITVSAIQDPADEKVQTSPQRQSHHRTDFKNTTGPPSPAGIHTPQPEEDN